MQTVSILDRIQLSGNSEPEFVISRVMIDFGIPPHIRGYSFIREAIMLLNEDYSNIYNITKHMYPEIARKYSTTPQRVERAIRHAIEVSWDMESRNKLRNYFPSNTVRPTNSEFLDFLYKWICIGDRI